jgi:hypothetical protein
MIWPKYGGFLRIYLTKDGNFGNNDHMNDFDYQAEKKKFLTEIEGGKFAIERIPNTDTDYSEKEDRDAEAYDEYLESNAFKQLKA